MIARELELTETAHTSTLLHSSSQHACDRWSVNVCGRKRWLLLPPEQTHLLYDEWGEETSPGFGGTSKSSDRFPNLALAKPLEVIQMPGEAIFGELLHPLINCDQFSEVLIFESAGPPVPAGWFHCVENLDSVVLSVNCNWLNACNLFVLFMCRFVSSGELN